MAGSPGLNGGGAAAAYSLIADSVVTNFDKHAFAVVKPSARYLPPMDVHDKTSGNSFQNSSENFSIH